MENLNNYFMKPTLMGNGISINPIKILDYNKFKILADKYILLDIKDINNQRRQEKLPKLEEDNLFDYIVKLIESFIESKNIVQEIEKIKDIIKKNGVNPISDDKVAMEIFKNEGYFISLSKEDHKNNIETLIHMSIGDDIKYNYNTKSFDIIRNEKKIGVIDRENFYEYRNIVMEQNLLFTPRIAPNKKSQEIIDKEIKKRFGDDDSSLESIISLVTIECGIKDISNYTYYRIMADYRTIIKKLNYESCVILKANGCKSKSGEIEIPNLQSSLGMNDNPYSNLLKKARETSLDKALQK